jgi:hypothetical protein
LSRLPVPLPKGQGAVNRFVSFGAERATAEAGKGQKT